MRVIQQDKHNPKRLEVTWMWLPMFIAQNQQMLGELDHVLTARFPPPFEPTERKLDEIHRFVIDWIASKLNIRGLWHYLLAIENVGDTEPSMKKLHLSTAFIELLGDTRLAELVAEGKVQEMKNVLTEGIEYFITPKEEDFGSLSG